MILVFLANGFEEIEALTPSASATELSSALTESRPYATLTILRSFPTKALK